MCEKIGKTKRRFIMILFIPVFLGIKLLINDGSFGIYGEYTYITRDESSSFKRGICGKISSNNDNLFENNININIDNLNDYHLSIILGTRNDNYGENQINRIITTLRQYFMFPWYNKYGLKIEIIITQYNYIPTNLFIYQEPLFIELMNDVNNTKYIENISIKFINVPHEYAYPSLHNISIYCPMLEFIAKNIALRRSKSQWKLVTNQDNFFPEPLLRWIASNIVSKTIDNYAIYQTTRAKIDTSTVKRYSNDNSSISCKAHLLTETECQTHPAGGDFNLIPSNILSKTGGYLEINGHWHLDHEFLIRVIKIHHFKTYALSIDNNDYYCKPLHIKHKRGYFNKYDLDIISSPNNSYKSITCDVYKDQLNRFKFRHSDINNPKHKDLKEFFDKVYETQTKSWGWYGTKFDIFKCSF